MAKCHCGKYACFNFLGETKLLFCSKHKEPNMVNVKNKTCEKCNKIPAYNMMGELKSRFCSTHKEPGMVNIKTKKCEYEGCETVPFYNKSGEKHGRFCTTHKEPGMINVKSTLCENEECETLPSYNFRGESNGRFCTTHKKPGMINVKSTLCENEACETIPFYNTRGEIKARFCTTHKEPGMVNVKDKTCEHEDCETIPFYNTRGEIKARFCTTHKEPGMINVKDKTCEHEDCEKIPTYNTRGEIKGRFCTTHKELYMINVTEKICEIKECESRALYGLLGRNLTYCSKHRIKGMIKYTKKKCASSCNHLGTYEFNGERYCEVHKPESSINLGIEKCRMCGLDDILTNGTCNDCDPSVVIVHRHYKENRVKDVLKASGIKFIHDKMLESVSCGRERPDFQIDCGDFFIYIEVDENQHQSYACECEQTRMVNLVHARGMPVTFIRYNPDVYEPGKGQRRMKLEQREKKLVEYIKHIMKHSPMEQGTFSNVLYLFYDGYDSHQPDWHTLIQ